ncbi:hypothetical protein COB21_03265 [Candidatus Aerophobetes bacterium]|uniref:Uncharacterized protein n=1 Tax=Aerophobetes bacterium TaxID=2030807 RepID=A0A2A4X3Z8_UNCAE|nr:MAG: hypothetical protein COB21_03265 [Candidatus Aerophobetes bacterium]
MLKTGASKIACVAVEYLKDPQATRIRLAGRIGSHGLALTGTAAVKAAKLWCYFKGESITGKVHKLPTQGIHDALCKVLSEQITAMSDEDKEACLIEFKTYLKEVLPGIIEMFLSKISIDELLERALTGIRDEGPSQVFFELASHLKQSYDHYIENNTSRHIHPKRIRATKSVVHKIIDGFAKSLSVEKITEVHTFFSNEEKIVATLREALEQTELVDNGEIDSDRMRTFLKLAIPDLEQIIGQTLVAASPQKEAASQGLVKVAMMVGGMHGAQTDPYLALFVNTTLPGMTQLLSNIHTLGFSQAIRTAIADNRIEAVKCYIAQVGRLLNLTILPGDLNPLFEGDELSETGENLISNIEQQCQGKPLSQQITSAIATIFVQTGYVKQENAPGVIRALDQYLTGSIAHIALDQLAKNVIPNLCSMPVKAVDGNTVEQQYLSTQLASSVRVLECRVKSPKEEISTALNAYIPWFLFSTLCAATGDNTLGTKENYFNHVLPHLDTTLPSIEQMTRITHIIMTKLLNSHSHTMKTRLKTAGMSTLLLFSDPLFIQLQHTLTFAGHHVEGKAFILKFMGTALNTVTNIRAGITDLKDRHIDPESPEWQEGVSEVANSAKNELFQDLLAQFKVEIDKYPKSKFKIAKTILNDNTLAPKQKSILFFKAVLDVIISPFIMLFLALSIRISQDRPTQHMLYRVISSLFETLDIEDENNLLSTILESTNSVLEEQANSLLIDDAAASTPTPIDPELDLPLLEFTQELMSEITKFNGSFPLVKIASGFTSQLHGVTATTRKAILDNLSPESFQGYVATALKSLVPKLDLTPQSSTHPVITGREHINQLGQRTAALTGSILTNIARMPIHSTEQACSVLLETFVGESHHLKEEIAKLKSAIRNEHSIERQQILMKKISYKIVYFIQEMERHNSHIVRLDEFAQYKSILDEWHQILSTSTNTFSNWKKADHPHIKAAYLLTFQTQITNMLFSNLDTMKTLLEQMENNYSGDFDSIERFNPLLSRAAPLVQTLVPGLVSNQVANIANVAAILAH